MNRRDFLSLGAMAGLGAAIGDSTGEAQAPRYPRLTKETWVLEVTPAMIDEYIAEHPLAGLFRGTRAVAENFFREHPLVHEYWRLGDNCIHGFSADRYTGKPLDFRAAHSGFIQGYILSAQESENERSNRGNHPVLPSRPVRLTGPAAHLSEPELLGLLADTLMAINNLQVPYQYLTTNSNKVFVTNAARLGFCQPINCSVEVEEVKPNALFGANVAFPVFPITRSPYQYWGHSGKSTTDIRTQYEKDRMAMFGSASADLRQIGPRKLQDNRIGLAV